jgi:hypothetical protein
MAYYILVCSSSSLPVVPVGQFPQINDCPSSGLQWIELPKTVELKMPQAHASDMAITFSLFYSIVLSIGLLAFIAGVVVKKVWHSTVRI